MKTDLMVLNNGIELVITLLSTSITGIAVGTSNDPVTGDETELQNQIIKGINTVNNLGEGYVQFSAQLEAADPAMLIQEIGLVDTGNNLLYRQIVNPQSKVAGVTYTLTYKIRIQ